jgi:hypothetical protein
LASLAQRARTGPGHEELIANMLGVRRGSIE